MSEDHDMIIRHEEQLKAIPQLSSAISRLTDQVSLLSQQLAVSDSRVTTVASCVGVGCSVLATVGTWFVMIHFKV